MAPKRPPPKEDPPPVSSSEEEEEEEGSSSTEEEESGEEEEQEPPTKPPPPHAQTSKSTPTKPESATKKAPEPESDSESGSEEDGTESESESEPEPQKKKLTSPVRPIASKPMAKSKTAPPPPAAASSQAKSSKRASEPEGSAKDPKRAKKDVVRAFDAGERSEDTKKLFQRLWNEDDEIAVLEGIIAFKSEQGMDAVKDMGRFLEYIKKSLHFDVALTQLKDKVSRLKKKFENQVKKGNKGEDKTFTKPHDQIIFDLSKKIWGVGGLESNAVKSNGEVEKKSIGRGKDNKKLEDLKEHLGMVKANDNEGENMEVELERQHGDKKTVKSDASAVGIANLEEYVMRRGLDVLDAGKRGEMEEKWKKLHIAELELFSKKHELLKEQADLMLAAYKI